MTTNESISTQLIVLGGGVNIEGDRAFLQKYSEHRAATAIAHYNQYRKHFYERYADPEDRAVIVCSGGVQDHPNPSDIPEQFREGSLMADCLVKADVPHQFIEKELESSTTLGNLLNTLDKKLISTDAIRPENPLGAVSHPHHLGRFVLFAAKIGIEPDLIQPIPTSVPDQALREFIWRQTYKLILMGASEPELLRAREQRLFNTVGRLRPMLRTALNKIPF